MKRFSILIAAFRAERWLEQCVDSIRAQRLPPDWEAEVLLGIDGCDATLHVARQLARNDLGVLVSPRNNGPYVTFNALMQHATGSVIFRFDADDVMQADFIAEHLDALAAGADLATAWSLMTNEQLQPVSMELAHENYVIENGEHRRGTDGQFALRRELWDTLGGFLPWRCGADTDLINRVRAGGFRIAVLEKFLYCRRNHAASLTTHPMTNFQSDLRKQYIALMKQYREEYRLSARPLRIEPVRGELERVPA